MTKSESFDRRGKSKSVAKLKNLPQYRDKTDEEIQAMIQYSEDSSEGLAKRFEQRIEEKLAKFSDDYDLTDLKINDREVLRGLVQSIISLEDYEQELFRMRSQGVNTENLLAIDKLQKVMEGIRKSISDSQNDLSITRKHRKSDQETSVIAYLENLKDKARKFYQARMSFVFCPKCHTLLCTSWFLFAEEHNVVTLVCKQKDKNGNPCDTKVSITSKKLLENRNTSDRAVTPDALV